VVPATTATSHETPAHTCSATLPSIYDGNVAIPLPRARSCDVAVAPPAPIGSRWSRAGVVGRRRRGRRLASRRRNGRGWVRGKGVAGRLGANAGNVGNLAPRPLDPDVIPPIASTTSGSPCAEPVRPTLPATPRSPAVQAQAVTAPKRGPTPSAPAHSPARAPPRAAGGATPASRATGSATPASRAAGWATTAEGAGHPALPPYEPRPLRRRDAGRRPRRLPTAPPEPQPRRAAGTRRPPYRRQTRATSPTDAGSAAPTPGRPGGPPPPSQPATPLPRPTSQAVRGAERHPRRPRPLPTAPPAPLPSGNPRPVTTIPTLTAMVGIPLRRVGSPGDPAPQPRPWAATQHGPTRYPGTRTSVNSHTGRPCGSVVPSKSTPWAAKPARTRST
jgi:hypothetical protein